MCGIVAYIGSRDVLPVLIGGLYRLEYRGYDSAGLAVLDPDDRLWSRKVVGRVAELEVSVKDAPAATVGISHTRWATHGGRTQANAHPHFDAAHKIAVVHNGIIENYKQLRSRLEKSGVVFRSETDSEVLVHLIAQHIELGPEAAVRAALSMVRGTYGIVVLFEDFPDVLVAARHGSPLVLACDGAQTFVASDPQALLEHTREVIRMKDRDIAMLRAGEVVIRRMDGVAVERPSESIDASHELADKEGYEHFMLKEIEEQPQSIERCLGGRLQPEAGNAKLGGLGMGPRELVGIQRVVCVGCGTAYHAGMIGAMAIEALARVPAHAEIANEFRYRHPIISPDALYLAISQSGETADTLAAVEEIQLKGGQVMGLINVVGSTIAHACGRGVYLHSGPEVAVASTKAFTSQITALLVFTLMLARTRDLSVADGEIIARALAKIPSQVEHYLKEPGPIDRVVELVKDARYVLFLGRGYSYPVAMEGALKLKEIAYIPCEGYPAGEMKHGPLAMIEQGTPVLVIAPSDSHRAKIQSNIEEARARGACVILIHDGDRVLAELADVAIEVPKTVEIATPLLTVLPLQLVAYRTARALGYDIDKPRNLAKSVTVE